MEKDINKIYKAFGLVYKERSFVILKNRISKIANSLRIGRVPSTIEELIVLYFVRKESYKLFKKIPHCEIGSLFGGSAIVSDLATGGKGKQICIDPLNGFYGDKNDPISGYKVNLKNLKINLQSYDSSILERTKIVKGYSNEEKVVEKFRNKEFSSLYIDGDHSFSGIGYDWFFYANLVKVGGFVIIDNYNDKAWPEVKIFVDSYIKKDKSWKLIYQGYRSYVIQKLSVVKNIGVSDFRKVFEIISYKNGLIEKYNKLAHNRLSVTDKLVEEREKHKVLIKNREVALAKFKDSYSKIRNKLSNRDTSLSRKSEKLAKVTKQLSNRDVTVAELKTRIKKLDKLVSNRDLALEKYKESQSKLETKVSNRDASLALEAEKLAKVTKQLCNRDGTVAELKTRIKKLDKLVSNRDIALEKSKESQSKLETKVSNRDASLVREAEKLAKVTKQLSNRDDALILEKEKGAKLATQLDNRDKSLRAKLIEIDKLKKKLANRDKALSFQKAKESKLKLLVSNRDKLITDARAVIAKIKSSDKVPAD